MIVGAWIVIVAHVRRAAIDARVRHAAALAGDVARGAQWRAAHAAIGREATIERRAAHHIAAGPVPGQSGVDCTGITTGVDRDA